MIILGLHFGHDAAATVVRDGSVRSYVMRERYTRVKHAASLDLATVRRALAAAGIEVADVDVVAVCSTQGVELIVDAPEALSVEFGVTDPFGVPCGVADELGASAAGDGLLAERGVGSLLHFVYDATLSRTWLGQSYAKLFPEHLGRERAEFVATPWIDTFITAPDWETGRGLAELASVAADPSDRARYGFHVPVKVRLDGREIPGYALHHHLAHAASGYYASGYTEAAVLTHDGYSDGQGYHSGMFYYGKDEALFPLTPHHLAIGGLYDRVGAALGLGVVGPAGKLMGLAAYGRPRFYDSRFLGNFADLGARFRNDAASAWLFHCRAEAQAMGYDLAPYGDPAQATAPINVDIAASTQKLFEEVRLEAVRALHSSLRKAKRATPNLCLSGGTALNCPSNTHIAADGPFRSVFAEPACDDGGIAIGAALAVFHSLLGNPLPPDRPGYPDPFAGVPPTDAEVETALADVADRIRFERCADIGADAADDLVADRVICWFEGGSEAGPRALGHRSILADPRQAENWPRVNRIKGRESWRPFAPAVLAEHAADWFRGLPLPSPYMLFNAQVSSTAIPAVTHVDGTARIQTVTADCGGYERVIRAFHERTGVPVVLNTSFNGPGEPIVETPAEALDLFLKSELDVLYLAGHRVTKNS